MKRRSTLFAIAAAAAFVPALAVPVTQAGAGTTSPAPHAKFDCAHGRLCTEVYDSEAVFGEGNYIGHDEPSALFYSNVPGAGNRMQYEGALPTEPPPSPTTGRSYSFELTPAIWFGMAMCDTQSYPETVSTCASDSDSNIKSPGDPNHAGAAFTELQFYPPGAALWPSGISCDATRWCVALNIDSLSLNPVTGQQLNDSCAQAVGVEYVNFAFLTKNGVPEGPPSPVNSTNATYTPDPHSTFFLNQGDHFTVTMHDTAHGLETVVRDTTTGQQGTMVASAANGFGQVKFAPTGTTCKNIPYDFHPMYSTSSEATRVPWTAHSYNIAQDTEIGHWESCSDVPEPFASCAGNEGGGEKADADDQFCFPAWAASLVKISGCGDFAEGNFGFDGSSYIADYPDGNPNHPTGFFFTSPRTGSAYDVAYSRVGFEADTPRIEDPDASPYNNCDRFGTGAGCTRVPLTDDHAPAAFYPFYTSGTMGGSCYWNVGNDIPGFTANDYGKVNQYGDLLHLQYIAAAGSPPDLRYNDFRQVIGNPC
jgi:hypothetical protein